MILSLNEIVFSRLHFRAECCIPILDILMNPISAIFLLLKGDFLFFFPVRLEIKPRVLYMLGEWSTAKVCHLPGFLKLWFLKFIQDLCLNCLFSIFVWNYEMALLCSPGCSQTWSNSPTSPSADITHIQYHAWICSLSGAIITQILLFYISVAF